MSKRLNKNFFLLPTLEVAKNLLGKFIVRKYRRNLIIGKIVEVEAYKGPKDRAAHSWGGKVTKRNKIVYQSGGYIYIYLCYGMYWQLNIVTSQKGKPECILIRALEPLKDENSKISEGEIQKLASGPGKLCRWLKLNHSFYGEDLTKSSRIWIEQRGIKLRPPEIKSTKRIGINYAGPYWAEKKWRFYIANNPFVSRLK